MIVPYQAADRLNGSSPDSSAKKASVLSALSACDMLIFGQVTVSVSAEYLILEGTVPDLGDDEKAVTIAEALVGTGYVRNRLLCCRQ